MYCFVLVMHLEMTLYCLPLASYLGLLILPNFVLVMMHLRIATCLYKITITFAVIIMFGAFMDLYNIIIINLSLLNLCTTKICGKLASI